MSAALVGEGRHIAVMNVVMQLSVNAIVKLKTNINNPPKAKKHARMRSAGDNYTVIKKKWLMLVQHPSHLMIISIQMRFQYYPAVIFAEKKA